MASLYVRNLPDSLAQQIRLLAASERRSFTAQAVVLLERAVAVELDDMTPAQMEAIGLGMRGDTT